MYERDLLKRLQQQDEAITKLVKLNLELIEVLKFAETEHCDAALSISDKYEIQNIAERLYRVTIASTCDRVK